MSKVYCHNCGRDFDGNDGERVCVHISIGGSDAIHAIEESDRKAALEIAKQRQIASEKAKSIATPDKESKSKTEGDTTPS